MFDRQLFAKRFKELREEKKINQKECAEQLGISRGSISFYENGERLPDIESIYAMSNFFDVSADYLIGLSNIKSPNFDIQFVCKFTGLSEAALKTIRGYRLAQLDEQKKLTYFLNKGEKGYTLADNVINNINDFIESTAFEKIIHIFTAENLNNNYLKKHKKTDINILTDEELEELHYFFDKKLDSAKANLYDIQSAIINYYNDKISDNIADVETYIEELKKEVCNRRGYL